MTSQDEKKAAAAEESAKKNPAAEHELHDALDRALDAKYLVKRYMLYTGGAGLIPIPVLDVASVGALQLKMIRELSDLYKIPFKENIVRGSISVLAGGLAAVSLAKSTGGLLKSVPLVGSVLGAASLGIYSSASTYAIGRVFIAHFESGGTFLTFNAEKYRDLYKKHFYSAKERGSKPATA